MFSCHHIIVPYLSGLNESICQLTIRQIRPSNDVFMHDTLSFSNEFIFKFPTAFAHFGRGSTTNGLFYTHTRWEACETYFHVFMPCTFSSSNESFCKFPTPFAHFGRGSTTHSLVYSHTRWASSQPFTSFALYATRMHTVDSTLFCWVCIIKGKLRVYLPMLFRVALGKSDDCKRVSELILKAKLAGTK